MSGQGGEEAEGRRRRSPRQILAAFGATLRGFGAERLLLRGAALTYLTIVSLVPFLAVVLWALQTFLLAEFQEPVREFLFEYLAVGVRESASDALDQVVANAGSVAGGSLGVLLLLGSAILLLRNVEKAFDDLWGIHAPRPMVRQLPRYVGLLVAGPIVLGLSLGATAALRAWTAVHGIPGAQRLLNLVPLLLSALGLSLLYRIAPAARVRWRPALLAGAVAAVVWEVAKVLFALYAAYVVRTDYLYGSLVAIPLFLVWIYVSWLIVLSGGRLAFAIQHPAGLRLGAGEEALARLLELCAARTMAVLAAAQRQSGEAVPIHRLALEAGFPEGMIRSLVPALESAGLVATTQRRLFLTRPAEQISLGDILLALRTDTLVAEFAADPRVRQMALRLREADRAAAQALRDRPLSDLA